MGEISDEGYQYKPGNRSEFNAGRLAGLKEALKIASDYADEVGEYEPEFHVASTIASKIKALVNGAK